MPNDAGPTEVDALGLLCPLPILRARREIGRLPPGSLLVLWADDEAIVQDLPAWCAGDGPELVEMLHATHPSGQAAWRCVVRRR